MLDECHTVLVHSYGCFAAGYPERVFEAQRNIVHGIINCLGCRATFHIWQFVCVNETAVEITLKYFYIFIPITFLLQVSGTDRFLNSVLSFPIVIIGFKRLE